MIQAPNDHDLVINLDGPDGNAFTLMAYAKQFARDMGYASDEVILISWRGSYASARVPEYS